MNFDPTEDKSFKWWHHGDLQWVVANWGEARRYHLNCHCENCDAVYSKRGGNSGICPNCYSDWTERLQDGWESLQDPWADDDVSVGDVESARITNY